MQKGIVKNYYSDYTVFWAGAEHDSLTYHALINMLPNDDKHSVYSFFSPYINVLRDYSKKPDLDVMRSISVIMGEASPPLRNYDTLKIRRERL